MKRAEFAAELGITVDRLREEEMSFILSEGFDDIGREYETLGDWIARTPTTDPRDPVDGGRGSGTLGPEGGAITIRELQGRRHDMYAQAIREECSRQGYIGMDPRHIEAYMRIEHSTLDNLSRAQFRAEVGLCIQCVLAGGEVAAEEAAQSFAL